MAPITWRNVQAPDFTGVGRLLDSAGRSLDKSVSGLANLASQGQQRLERNQDIASNSFIDHLSQNYSNAGDLKKAEASGELNQLRQQFGSNTGGLNSDISGYRGVSKLGSTLEAKARKQEEYAYRDEKRSNAKEDRATRLERSELLFGQSQDDRIRQFARQDEQDIRSQQALDRSLADRAHNKKRQAINESRADAQFARQDTNRQQAEDRENITREEYLTRSNFQDLSNQAEQAAAQILLNNNIPKEALQSQDAFNSLLPEQQDIIRKVKNDIFYEGSNPSATEQRSQLIDKFIDKGFSVQQAIESSDQVDNLGLAAKNISVVDKQEYNDQLQALSQKPEYLNSSAVKAIQNPEAPIDTLNKLVDNNKDLFKEFGPGTRLEVDNFLQDILQGGIPFEGTRMPVTYEMANYLLNTIGAGNLIEWDVEDIAKELVSSPAFAQDRLVGEKYKQELNALKNNLSSKTEDTSGGLRSLFEAIH